MSVTSVDEYMTRQSEAAQRALARVRSAVRKAVPGADEVISYKIPTYKLHGRVVLYFAGWKQHYSLYPAGKDLLAAFKADLSPYEVRGSTIRFPLSASVPVKLIERLARFRAKQLVARAKAKAPALKKR
jgi:uncharacterized protein YdhG (YjbR/CyaY superfamily)